MCGLAGIISKEKTDFNINHFNILGSFNDERGGDSCGIFIDGKVEYGIGENAVFRTFTMDKKYPDTASIALVHCRKASYGMPLSIDQAHPIVFRNSQDEIEYVVMHNGTITNANALATKYCPELNTFGKSDTQIMAYIMYCKGYDVLEEYQGTAVFIIVDYRGDEPDVLLFKGSSVFNESKCKYERPLYCAVKDDKFYFSSMYTSLYCIDNTFTIMSVPTNQLVVVNDTELLLIQQVNRSKLTKTKHTQYSFPQSNVVFNQINGTYLIDGIPAQGEYYIYPSGYISNVPSPSNMVFYFYAGRLLYNKDCFDLLNDIANLFPDLNLSVYFPEIIDYFAYGCVNRLNSYYKVDENFNYVPVHNYEWSVLFTNTMKHVVEDGKHTQTFVYPTDAQRIFIEKKEKQIFDLDVIESKIYRYIYQSPYYVNF